MVTLLQLNTSLSSLNMVVSDNNASSALANEGVLSWLTNLEDEVKAGATESKAADDSILEAISRLEGDSKSRDHNKHNSETHDQ